MQIIDRMQMRRLAYAVAKCLTEGDVLRLDGELGAGKTTFAQWIGESLGVTGTMQSPTFSLVRHYPCSLGMLNHMDFYRMEEEGEIEALDYEELLYPSSGISILEWAENIASYLPSSMIWLSIRKREGEGRDVSLLSDGGNEKVRLLFEGGNGANFRD